MPTDLSRYRTKVLTQSTRAGDGRNVIQDTGWYIVNYGRGDCIEPEDYTHLKTLRSDDKEVTGTTFIDPFKSFTQFDGVGGDVILPLV